MGTRFNTGTPWHADEDHPHACGDKKRLGGYAIGESGSSPRVWGQVSDIIVSLRTSRIIPTRVGTSKMTKKEEWEAKDHPHACGDKTLGTFGVASAIGSSPRVWGQAAGAITSLTGNGIIPTRVGTRYRPHCRGVMAQDHPHACGDKFRAVFHQRKLMGSSPRVWGQEFQTT